MKKYLVCMICILLALSVIPFNIALPQAKITLTFMTPLGGSDGAYMDQLIQKFNKQNPDIEISHVVIADSLQYKQKLSTGLATKSAPHVLFIRKFDMPLYLDQFKSFTFSELLKYGINIRDVYPNLLEGLVKDNKYYGIPLDVWIFYMAYNKANFKKAGLNPERPPKNRAEFVKALEALKNITPKGVTPWYLSPTSGWVFAQLLWQHGGDYLTSDFKKPAFYDAAVQVCNFLMDLQDRGLLAKANIDYGSAFSAFESGQSSLVIFGIWTINPWLEKLGKDFGYAPCPQLGTKRVVFGGSHVLAMPAVMVQDKKVFEAAMKWVKFLWDNAIDWYAAGQTPARGSIAKSEELKRRLPHIYTVAQQLSYVKTLPFFPYISEVLSEVGVHLEEVLITRERKPEDAMKEATTAVQKILDDYWSKAGR